MPRTQGALRSGSALVPGAMLQPLRLVLPPPPPPLLL
jgi:hypothetical protein